MPSKGEAVGAEEVPTGESGSLRSLPLFPHLLGAHPWAVPAAGVQEAPGGLYWGWRVQGARSVGWGGIVWGQREEQYVSHGFAESTVCSFPCPPQLPPPQQPEI